MKNFVSELFQATGEQTGLSGISLKNRNLDNEEISMKTNQKLLLTSAVCLALGIASSGANAETVSTTTVVTQKEVPNVRKTDFASFDLNRDNILSMVEVGEKLFYIFDTDGNQVIDNIEFTRSQVMTIIPMEKQTFTFVDVDSDGVAEQQAYNYETFLQQSRLMRFDKDMDGLSPADFIGATMLKLDIDKSGVIELTEWKKAYIDSVIPPVAEQVRYNR